MLLFGDCEQQKSAKNCEAVGCTRHRAPLERCISPGNAESSSALPLLAQQSKSCTVLVALLALMQSSVNSAFCVWNSHAGSGGSRSVHVLLEQDRGKRRGSKAVGSKVQSYLTGSCSPKLNEVTRMGRKKVFAVKIVQA